jgi:hypothetical protein
MTQLLAMQQLLMADVQCEETKASVRAQCTRAWKELQELRLRMLGKGPPAPVRDTDPKRKPRASASPIVQPQEPPGPVSTPQPPLSTPPA